MYVEILRFAQDDTLIGWSVRFLRDGGARLGSGLRKNQKPQVQNWNLGTRPEGRCYRKAAPPLQTANPQGLATQEYFARRGSAA